MSQVDDVPIFDVHKENFTQVWPSLLLAMKTSSFIAVDLELSGLGNRKALVSKSIDDRYKNVADVARTRAAISMGISTFKLNTEKDDTKKISYLVQTFNIWLLCNEDYVIEPAAVRFLVHHGFDFNKQYRLGVPYSKGTNNTLESDLCGQTVRGLFLEMVLSKKMLVLHNGLVDLAFLYHNLYADLPATLHSFVSDLSEIFEGGIYDTKYISEFHSRTQASYLEYLFKKMQRDNQDQERLHQNHVHIHYLNYGETPKYVEYRTFQLSRVPGEAGSETQLCTTFANFGWCPNEGKCKLSHSVDTVLDQEATKRVVKQEKRRRRMNRKRQHSNGDESIEPDLLKSLHQHGTEDSNSDTTDASVTAQLLETDPTSTSPSVGVDSSHRAGYDAFMTGFAFAVMLAKHGKCPTDTNVFSPEATDTTQLVNKVYLCGKDIPLTIAKSAFAKTSKDHRAKWDKLKESR